MPPRPAASTRSRARVVLVASLLALFLLVLLLINGCTPAAPQATPSPQAPAVAFASEEEALAAAEKVLEDYLAMADLILQEGAADPERIAPLVTEKWLEVELAGYAEMRDLGVRQEGISAVSATRFQQMFLQGSTTSVMIYACIDYDESMLVDGSGERIGTTEPNTTVEVTFEAAPESSLKVAAWEKWGKGSLC
ncbi:hypothetical protein FB562_1774 [Homoserinimonas aerilata]|uniref:Uncharacterized protein n=1 Tax=Homoserinimonas aerilata TaxID=1162970 RepID=A0A542YKR0_9MICO|nr:hypothetical protein [Homoserinimonas aerilata]TQL48676.1 hypothetical protein FB562_1774 [Homoserinimonas aerilata]